MSLDCISAVTYRVGREPGTPKFPAAAVTTEGGYNAPQASVRGDDSFGYL